MTLDSGVATVWRGRNAAPAGALPNYVYDKKITSSYYADKTVGLQRFWTAKAHDDRADLLVEIERCSAISAAEDQCEIAPYMDLDAAGMYKILQVQQVTDNDGLPKTDLTLQRIEVIMDGGNPSDPTEPGNTGLSP